MTNPTRSAEGFSLASLAAKDATPAASIVRARPDNPAAMMMSRVPADPRCQLVQPRPTSNYAVKGGTPYFQPDFAKKLEEIFASLHAKGIRPTITSGYRSPKKQRALKTDMKAAGSKIPVANRSAHFVGLGVDFGPGNNDLATREALFAEMTRHGVSNGRAFNDARHYYPPHPMARRSDDMIKACLDTARSIGILK